MCKNNENIIKITIIDPTGITLWEDEIDIFELINKASKSEIYSSKNKYLRLFITLKNGKCYTYNGECIREFGIKETMKENKEKEPLIPIEATNIGIFNITEKEVFIGFKLKSGFNFVQVPIEKGCLIKFNDYLKKT